MNLLDEEIARYKKSIVAKLFKPYDKLVFYICNRSHKNVWTKTHYIDYTQDQLIDRILFLQDCGKHYYVRHNLMKLWLPVAIFVTGLVAILL